MFLLHVVATSPEYVTELRDKGKNDSFMVVIGEIRS